jgi:hypothetical protein
VRYERTWVHRIASAFAKRHLPGSQWTNNTDPGLQYNYTDRSQVREAKPQISNPAPIAKFSHQDKCETEHHECHEQGMTEKKQVGSQKV